MPDTPAAQSFADFGLDSRLLEAVRELGYETPTPIQVKAIPAVMAGRDVMGAAQTGTGKTAGYGLPALQRLLPLANSSASPARHPVRMLILAPTRELADQVNDSLASYAAHTQLRVAAVYGGVDIKPQVDALRRGVEVLTATPGRLLDHLESRAVSLSQVGVVVLDEADRMLDMGFLPDISRILSLLPERRQNLMFSATFSPDIKKLAQTFLRDPEIIEVARRNSAAATVRQVFYRLGRLDRTEVLTRALRDSGPDGVNGRQALVFVNAKITCRRLARALVRAGLAAESIHGDKTQQERMAALAAFKAGQVTVLVATDVAARGLDIEDLPAVVNYDVPFVAEDYVHRIGRTGRAGQAGLAITLVGPEDDRSLAAIERLLGKKATLAEPPRGEEARERHQRRPVRAERDHEGRVAPAVGGYRQAAWDPIFENPYDASAPSAPVPKPESVIREGPRPKKQSRPLAALLGGDKR